MGQWIYFGILARISINPTQACQGVLTVDIHGARPADALTTRAAKRKRRIDFVLDLNQSVQNLI